MHSKSTVSGVLEYAEHLGMQPVASEHKNWHYIISREERAIGILRADTKQTIVMPFDVAKELAEIVRIFV